MYQSTTDCQWHSDYLIAIETITHNGRINLKADYIGPLGVDTHKMSYFDSTLEEAIADFVAELKELGKPAD